MRLGEIVVELATRLDRRTLLEQLAEEASELSQAALKSIRAERLSGNPTPVEPGAAWLSVIHERDDVLNCLYLLGLSTSPGSEARLERWAERLREEK